MEREAPLCVRVTRELFEDARRAAGLPVSASQGQVVRWALALLAGRPDPAAEALVPLSVRRDYLARRQMQKT
jgi:hypothetical protein